MGSGWLTNPACYQGITASRLCAALSAGASRLTTSANRPACDAGDAGGTGSSGKGAVGQGSASHGVQQVLYEGLLRDPDAAEQAYLACRADVVRRHFPTALSADDFFHRLEVALHAFGFTGENSIAMTNLCRDEVTIVVKDKIEQVFGGSFVTSGLGGVLTCGVTGVRAGLSHSPVCASSGKERYVFFSFPHISINADGVVGKISRPWRRGQSSACGALIACLGAYQSEGLAASCKPPGVHDYADPELSLLKHRLARRIKFEGLTDEQASGIWGAGATEGAEGLGGG